MIDIHIHSNYSADGVGKLEDYIKLAIKKGIKAIGFSEHIDFDYEVLNMPIGKTDFPAFYEEFCLLREKYKNNIKVLLGCECGYDILAKDKINEFLDSYPFDYNIISTHLSGREDCWKEEYYIGKTREEAFSIYLQSYLEAAKAEIDYDIISHLGYVVRKSPYELKKLDLETFGDLIDEILKVVISRNKVLEINSSTRGTGLCNPDEDIIKRYIELGGSKFSFGSDAHDVDRYMEKHDEIAKLLKSLNVKYTIHFENGKEVYDKL